MDNQLNIILKSYQHINQKYIDLHIFSVVICHTKLELKDKSAHTFSLNYQHNNFLDISFEQRIPNLMSLQKYFEKQDKFSHISKYSNQQKYHLDSLSHISEFDCLRRQ